MSTLPNAASLAVARIEAMLDEAKRLIEQTGASDESAFSLRETERRYLPDTLNAYLNVPPSGRDAVADSLLIDQLGLLERATAQRLAALAEAGRSNLAANGAFLAERFSAETLPEAVSDPGAYPAVAADAAVTVAPPRALVARFFSDLGATPRMDPAVLLDLIGRKFGAVFPALTTIRRGLFGGPVKSIAIDVPLGADVLRYTLEAERGGVNAACTKIVRGVALRTERADVGVWMQHLLNDMTAFVEADRASRELLSTFLTG
jgi:hypothetical protein